MLASLLSLGDAFAGAWPVPAGQGQIITTTLVDRSSKSYDDDGQLSIDQNFSKDEISLYYELGLTSDYTLVLQTGVQDIKMQSGDGANSFSGLGESTIGIRRVLWRGRNSVVSAQGSLIFGNTPELISDASFGVGGTHVETRLLAGHSFKLFKKNGFAEVQSAWRLRFGETPDEYRFAGTIGVRPVSNIQILTQGFYTIGNGADEADGFDIAIRPNKRLKMQMSAVVKLNNKTSMQLGSFRTMSGRNIVKEKAVFVGLWTRF